MKLPYVLAGALALATLTSQPAAAQKISFTGYTKASPQLRLDVLRRIAQYSKASGGCAFVFSAHMEIMPRSYMPVQPSMPATSRGGHFERWTLNACGARQRFQIAMWPSRRGGSDFAVTPLTGRRPLHARR